MSKEKSKIFLAVRSLSGALAMVFFSFSSIASPNIRAQASGIYENFFPAETNGSNFGASAGIEIQPTDSSIFRLDIQGRYIETRDGISENIILPRLGIGLSFDILKNLDFFGKVFLGYAFSSAESSNFDGANLGVEAGMEYKIVPVLGFRIFASASPLKNPPGEKNGYRSIGAGIGISYLFGFVDSDHDWVPDKLDICPKTPKGAKVNEKGCPLDSDGDGVFDGFDRCPNTAFEAIVDSFGCPSDADGDGVPDGVDRCDATPKGIKVDSTGCPNDADKDGVPDFADTCAKTPIGALVNEAGCPKDSDEDGVYDGIDQCPQTPTGFVVNSVGCPYAAPVEFEVIYDAYDAGLNLKAAAMQKIDQIAERLRAYPFRIVEIGVYTDEEGSEMFNVGRGMRVAEKVRDVLVARGVKKESLALKGYGEASPVASNATEEGRMKNRRIVFKFLRNG